MINPLPASYSMGKTTSIPLKIDQEQDRDVHFYLLFNIVLEVLATAFKQEEKIKLSFFAGDMILYIEDLKDPPGNY